MQPVSFIQGMRSHGYKASETSNRKEDNNYKNMSICLLIVRAKKKCVEVIKDYYRILQKLLNVW